MNDLFNKMFDRIDDGYGIVKISNEDTENKSYTLIWSNKGLPNLLGISLEDILQKKINQVFPSIDGEWEALFSNLSEASPVSKFIAYVDLYKKHLFVKAVYLEALTVGIFISYIDRNNILREKLNEENLKLKEATEKLEITKQKLVEEDKLASIGQLSAGIAHEINNPLGFVLSNFETLKKYIDRFKETIMSYRDFSSKISSSMNTGSIDVQELIKNVDDKKKLDFIMEDLNELFQDTEDGLERVRKIVLALRTFSRQDKDGSFELYDLNAGIETTLLIAKNEVKYNSEVEMELGEIPLIDANSGQINQVLLNLIVNASHAIRERHHNEFGKIKIKTYEEGEYVYCCIEDNGTGISEENLKNVFKPFFTTKPSGIGTGLGLSISYDIIKNKHNGDIFIESKENEYTRISLKLPIKQANEGE